MQAVILAGGKGRRLQPYTTIFPKPLMPIGEYPILEVVVRQLKRYGFTDITLAVGHLQELLRAFFGDGEKWGVNIRYSTEDQPLGTAGPLRNIPDLADHFLLMNGDILTDLHFEAVMRRHVADGDVATIVTHRRAVKIDYGTLEIGKNNRLRSYTEKPTLHYDVSMGVYALSRRAVDFIPDNQYFDFPDLIHTLLAEKEKVACYPYDGYWLDIGRPDDYEIAVEDFEKMKGELLP